MTQFSEKEMLPNSVVKAVEVVTLTPATCALPACPVSGSQLQLISWEWSGSTGTHRETQTHWLCAAPRLLSAACPHTPQLLHGQRQGQPASASSPGHSQRRCQWRSLHHTCMSKEWFTHMFCKSGITARWGKARKNSRKQGETSW